jgi:hypothetical protein
MVKYLFLLLLTCISLSAQNFGRLRGFVTDSTSGEALPYANVYLEDIQNGASTDERGLFLINQIPADLIYEVNISFVGYETKKVNVFIKPNSITELNVELAPQNYELNQIEKLGEKIILENDTDIGLERLTVKKIQSLPQGVEIDIFRSLQYIPGVQSTGDVSAKYYVRGGTGDQNLVLINGATLYNPFHALGLFSVIDPEMINSVDFYKGGFSSQFGGRVSSVLNVITKNGNRNKFSSTASASFLSGKILFEGPIPNGSFILTGRKSYSNAVFDKFLNSSNVPIDFYDTSFKLNFSNDNIIRNGRFYFFGFISDDKIDEEDAVSEDFQWSNNLFGFEWVQVYDVSLFSRMGITYSSFEGKVIPNLSGVKQKENLVSDVTFSMDFNYVWPSKDEIGFGVNFKSVDTKLLIENSVGAISDVKKYAGSFLIYSKYKFLRWDNFGLDLGFRFNITGLTEEGNFTFEPRLNTTYNLFPFLRVKASAGVYIQELATISDERDIISIFEPWTILPDGFEPIRALHYSAGLNMFITSNFSINAEAYYKKVHNLAAVNEKKYFNSDPDLVSGSGESYGVEISTEFNKSFYSISANYTLSWAYKDVNDWLYYPKYDSRHNLNLSFDLQLGSGLSANLVWSFNSGAPFTPIVGYYDKLGGSDLFDTFVDGYTFRQFTILGDKNIERLPTYHRLDLTVTKKTTIFFMDTEISASIINIYDRKNIFYYKRDTGEKVYMLSFLPTLTLKVEL